MRVNRSSFLAVLLLLFVSAVDVSFGQSVGTELHNMLMPASGGMGGVSISAPQDLTSAINANPATLRQFRGTQFQFGGAWAEPTFNLTQTNALPTVGPSLIDPFSAKSTAPGSLLGNIGVTQDLSELGLPATMGLGFISAAGGAIDFRHIPESGGTNSGQTVFSLPMVIGMDLTDRLSVGAGVSIGTALFDGPFVGLGGLTSDYALRGTTGLNYQLTPATTMGAYYQSEQSFRFDHAIRLNVGGNPQTLDVNMDLPQNIGFGIANQSLMNGNLLIGVDVLYKYWDEAALYDAIYDNQLVVQFGTQLTRGRYRLRAGYVWAENPLDSNPGPNLGGVIQDGGLPVVRYSQGLLAVTSQHRMTLGLGITDILPGVDLDLMGGGMFQDDQQLGPFTATSIESYWLGFGMTWRYSGGMPGVCVSQAP